MDKILKPIQYHLLVYGISIVILILLMIVGQVIQVDSTEGIVEAIIKGILAIPLFLYIIMGYKLSVDHWLKDILSIQAISIVGLILWLFVFMNQEYGVLMTIPEDSLYKWVPVNLFYLPSAMIFMSLEINQLTPLLKLINVLLPSVLVTLGSVLRKVVKTKDGMDNIF